MQNPMDQFLSAMRGLEGVKTPLSVETPTLTGGTQESQQRRATAQEMEALAPLLRELSKKSAPQKTELQPNLEHPISTQSPEQT
jgi:hypothetical protein